MTLSKRLKIQNSLILEILGGGWVVRGTPKKRISSLIFRRKPAKLRTNHSKAKVPKPLRFIFILIAFINYTHVNLLL